MTPDQLLTYHQTMCDQARGLMERKNHDYRGGTGDPFANFRGSTAFGVDPVIGILLRMQDKMNRIRTFATSGMLHVAGEKWGDSIHDLINYPVLLGGLLTERAGQQAQEDRMGG
jgi:hypothetical protein